MAAAGPRMSQLWCRSQKVSPLHSTVRQVRTTSQSSQTSQDTMSSTSNFAAQRVDSRYSDCGLVIYTLTQNIVPCHSMTTDNTV